MSEINLKELIINNLEFLGLNSEFSFKNREIIKYFLDNNITSIFGKTTFKIDSFNESNSEINIIKFKNNNKPIIRIINENMHFDFLKYNDELVLFNRQTGLKLFKISLKNNIYQNILVSIDEPNIVSEIQKYDLDTEVFEYTKTIRCYDEIQKYPIFKMKRIGSKIQDKELFEFSYYVKDLKNMNFKSRIKYLIKHKQNKYVTTGYKINEEMPYIDEIFKFMQNECCKMDENLEKILSK